MISLESTKVGKDASEIEQVDGEVTIDKKFAEPMSVPIGSLSVLVIQRD